MPVISVISLSVTLDDILVLNIKIIHYLENSDQSKMSKEPRDNHKGKYLLISNFMFLGIA